MTLDEAITFARERNGAYAQEQEERDYAIIRVRRETMPKGVKLVEAYDDGANIVVMGCPDESDESHNCDAMGCGWAHVLFRFKKA